MTPHPDERGVWLSIGRWSVVRPWRTLGFAGLCTVLGLYFALQLRPSAAVTDMLSGDDAAVRSLADLAGHFRLVDNLIILVRVPEDRPADTPALVAFGERLGRELADEPRVAELRFRVSGQYQRFVEQVVAPHALCYLDAAGLEALAARLTRAAMDRQFQRNAVLAAAPGPAAGLDETIRHDPLRLREMLRERVTTNQAPVNPLTGSDYLVSGDGRALLIQITGAHPANDLAFAGDLMRRVRAAVDTVNHDSLRIDYTGAYAIADYSASSIRNDMIRSCIGSVVLLVLLFTAVYRSAITIVILLAPVSMAIVIGFGVFSLLWGVLTPITSVAGAMLAGLGVDYCLHYLSHFQAQRAHGDGDPAQAAVRTTVGIGPAILAACMTSVLGFSVLAASHIAALRQFSLLGVLGLSAAWLAAVTVLPAMLVLLKRRVASRPGQAATRMDMRGVVLGLARTSGRWMIAFAVVVCAAVVVLGYAATAGNGSRPLLDVDEGLEALYPRPHPPLETQATVAALYGTSPNSLMIHLKAESPDALLRLGHEVQRRLTGGDLLEAGISGLVNPATMLPDPALRDDPRAVEALGTLDPDKVIGDFRAAAGASVFEPRMFAEYEQLLGRMIDNRTPPGWSDLAAYPDLTELLPTVDRHAPTQALVMVRMEGSWSADMPRSPVIAAIRHALGDLRGVTLTGQTVIGHDTQQGIVREVERLTLLAGAAVLLWLAVLFRDWRGVLLALMPVGLGIVVLLAVIWLFDWKLNAINFVAAPLIVGIGVDDGIFLTMIYRGWRRSGAPADALIGELTAGTFAILMTSLTTMLAFGSLVFSTMPAVRSLGVLTATGVGIALAVSLFALAPLLLHASRRTPNVVSPS